MNSAQILVVDDEAAVRESLRRALALEGYDVELAADGAEALYRLDIGEVQPDAIVLDVLMPNVDGLETARRLRGAGNRIPILMLTARDEVEARVAGLDAGADDERLGRDTSFRRPRARSGDPGGQAGRRANRADAHGVLAAGALHAQPAAGAHALVDLRARLGLRLRPLVEFARRLHRLPAPEDRSRRQAAPDPDGTRRRLRTARAVSFRTRLTLVAAAAVAFAILAASLVVFLVVRNQLRGQVDSALTTRARQIENGPPPHLEVIAGGQRILDVGGPLGFGSGDFVQVVDASGHTYRTLSDAEKLPPNDDALAAAKGRPGSSFSDARIGGEEVRVFTIPVQDEHGNQYALQVARSLGEVNHTLGRITIFLILIAAGGIAIAGGLGLVVSQAALAPVRRLTRATDKVAETRDLSERIEATGEDELSRLAASFNTMLAALEESDRAKRQLVSDASHELRTPLTSLRTNIEVLARDRNIE